MFNKSRNPLYGFFLRAALWLPVCLGIWYWEAEWLSTPAAWLSGWVMQGAFPEWVDSVVWSHRTVSVATTLQFNTLPGMTDNQQALLVVEANPLSYSFGLPIFASLLLANKDIARWRKLILGALILIPFQVWGICFDLLKQVAITAGPAIAAQTGFLPWQREGIALGYQLGSLILPTLVPIGLWLVFNRQFIPMLMLERSLNNRLRDS